MSKIFIDEVSLLKIFSYLPVKSLNTCMCVCKSWNKLVNETKIKRKKRIQTILYSSDKDVNIDNLAIDIRSQFNQFKNEPELSLLFLTNTAADEVVHTIDILPSANSKTTRLFKKLQIVAKPCDILKRNYLPPSKFICLYSAGIIGTNYQDTNTNEIETLDDEVGMTGLFLPKSEHYKLKLIKLTNQTKIPVFKTTQEFNSYFDLNENNDEELKYLVVFGDKKSKVKLDGFFDFMNKNLKHKVAICGSYVDRFEFNYDGNDENDTQTRMILLAFSGGKNFNVSQIVIPYADDDDERRDLVGNKLNELKTKSDFINDKNNQTFALQIACLSRGQAYYSNELNFESKKFKEIFPKIPLVGVFGYGELGVDFLNENKTESEDIDWIGYSTVVSLISVTL